MTDEKEMKIKVTANGPYLVTGGVPLERETVVPNGEGIPVRYDSCGSYPTKEQYALCRCGASKDRPFCDGAHSKIGFDGEETASDKSFSEQAVIVQGPTVDLADALPLCARLKFCQRDGGERGLIKRSDDPKCREDAIEIAGLCAAGRLVVREKDGKDIEPRLTSSISVLEEPDRGASGPLWVKNGIAIESADGTEYERRNRVTLCRCGASKNKPFCDGAHYNGRNDRQKKND